jgi:hypothetical protein
LKFGTLFVPYGGKVRLYIKVAVSELNMTGARTPLYTSAPVLQRLRVCHEGKGIYAPVASSPPLNALPSSIWFPGKMKHWNTCVHFALPTSLLKYKAKSHILRPQESEFIITFHTISRGG